MVEHRLRQLRDVVEAVELSRGFPRTVDRRQRQTDQRGQNRNHDQQLDKREAAARGWRRLNEGLGVSCPVASHDLHANLILPRGDQPTIEPTRQE